MKKNLKFSDRWMFNRVMCQEGVCRDVLRAVTGIEVGRIEYLNAEQAKEPTAAGHGVRMDVFAREGNRVYDVEMQLASERNLGQRMRYYQAALDATELDSGDDYGSLPESFIIFICPTDALGAGLPLYAMERLCLDAPDVVLGNRSHWLILNASGWERSSDPQLRDLLKYLNTGNPEGDLAREIDSFVEEYNRDREWVTKVLTYEQDTAIRCRRAKEEGMEEGRKQGIEQGIEQGMDRLGSLIERLLGAGRIEDAARVSADPAYRERLLLEFGL